MLDLTLTDQQPVQRLEWPDTARPAAVRKEIEAGMPQPQQQARLETENADAFGQRAA